MFMMIISLVARFFMSMNFCVFMTTLFVVYDVMTKGTTTTVPIADFQDVVDELAGVRIELDRAHAADINEKLDLIESIKMTREMMEGRIASLEKSLEVIELKLKVQL